MASPYSLVCVIHALPHEVTGEALMHARQVLVAHGVHVAEHERLLLQCTKHTATTTELAAQNHTAQVFGSYTWLMQGRH